MLIQAVYSSTSICFSADRRRKHSVVTCLNRPHVLHSTQHLNSAAESGPLSLPAISVAQKCRKLCSSERYIENHVKREPLNTAGYSLASCLLQDIVLVPQITRLAANLSDHNLASSWVLGRMWRGRSRSRIDQADLRERGNDPSVVGVVRGGYWVPQGSGQRQQ